MASDEELRRFCIEQSIRLIQCIKTYSMGEEQVSPFELSELLFKYIKTGEAFDLPVLRFG